jgi:hypothetical protein
MSVVVLHNAAATVATFYSSALQASSATCIGVDITHPAVNQTTYTIQGTNAPKQDQGVAANWFDYDAVTIPAKTSAERFGVRLTNFPFAAMRVKMVNTAGTNTVTISALPKGR